MKKYGELDEKINTIAFDSKEFEEKINKESEEQTVKVDEKIQDITTQLEKATVSLEEQFNRVLGEKITEIKENLDETR